MDNEVVVINKLVNGGQGIGSLADGKTVFVWNVLPGEKVQVRIIKNKKDYAEAIAEEIIEPSKDRIMPREENYLATSPWQMMTYVSENKYKKEIIQEVFKREKVSMPDFTFTESESEWHYRNKMEYSFWGDDDGLHLALHRRGSRGKQIVDGSELAIDAIDKGANAILAELRKTDVRAGDLKSLIVRCSQSGEVVAALFTKRQELEEMLLPEGIKGLRVYHSNPKSPASVPTKLLYETGDATLTDTILEANLAYDVDSFFQVNIPIFEKALLSIKQFVDGLLTDMYGGVGTIGLALTKDPVIVELDPATVAMAKRNAEGTNANVIHTSSEKALEYIVGDRTLVVDPPRAGLHKDVIEKILDVKPARVIYLSCNPATQARDLALLQSEYTISYFEGFNFFPRTPHIETLAILQRT